MLLGIIYYKIVCINIRGLLILELIYIFFILYIYIYIYILSSTDRLFCCITTHLCG